MMRPPPRYTLTAHPCPSTSLFRSRRVVPRHAPQRQDGRSLERLVGGRISWRAGAAARARGARRRDDHPDGPAHAARLRDRLGAADARRARAGALAHGAPLGFPTPPDRPARDGGRARSEEHTSELQSLMRISYAVFSLKNKTIRLNEYLNILHQ